MLPRLGGLSYTARIHVQSPIPDFHPSLLHLPRGVNQSPEFQSGRMRVHRDAALLRIEVDQQRYVALAAPWMHQTSNPLPREAKTRNSMGASERTQGQGTGNGISVDPHVPELVVDRGGDVFDIGSVTWEISTLRSVWQHFLSTVIFCISGNARASPRRMSAAPSSSPSASPAYSTQQPPCTDSDFAERAWSTLERYVILFWLTAQPSTNAELQLDPDKHGIRLCYGAVQIPGLRRLESGYLFLAGPRLDGLGWMHQIPPVQRDRQSPPEK
ncbi:uncharacterized protein N7459_000512 [Penicillium hispanicum]|uniref:uncharacterized protein n=1 Tax=Penicillium hispanicum TaxID=1080232 RepID=UPI00254018F4|nr:uncharacterized protein N7459_000512 [Penicillium hispanicum]KAJ5594304.1 hypothetical protein N7459_000512 [Penicillium hispanicum]